MKEGLKLPIELRMNVVPYSLLVGGRVANCIVSWIGGGLTSEYGINRGLTSLENLEFVLELIKLVSNGKDDPKSTSLKVCVLGRGKGLLSSRLEEKLCC